MPVDRQNDRLIESRLDGFRFGERRLSVRARDLGSSRQRLVRHPAPAAHHAADPRVDLDVVAERYGVDEEAVLEVVQANSDLLARRVEKRTDVNVGLELVAPQQVEREIDQRLCRVWK